MVAEVTVAGHVVVRAAGPEVDHVVEALTNHKDLGRLILITQKTTIMALKNETKSSETKKGQSLPNKRETRPIGKKAVEASEAEALTEGVVDQTEVVVVGVAVGIRIALNKRLYLIRRTATSKL